MCTAIKVKWNSQTQFWFINEESLFDLSNREIVNIVKNLIDNEICLLIQYKWTLYPYRA